MKKKIPAVLLVLILCVGTASAQFGSGIVYDPTNYQNALLRYYQLAAAPHSTAAERRQSHRPSQPSAADGAVRQKHARSLPRVFSQWRNVTSLNTFGNTGSWISGINSGLLPNINTGYLKATTQLLPYNPYELSGMNASELGARAVPIRVRRTRGRREHERDGHHRLDPWQRRQCPDSDRKPRTRFVFGRLQVSTRKSPS